MWAEISEQAQGTHEVDDDLTGRLHTVTVLEDADGQ